MYRLARSFLRATDAKVSEAAAAAASGKGLKLRLVTPTETLVKDKYVKMVTIPGTEGMMGVTANHAPIIAELKPGPVNVHWDDSKITKYFTSGGFAVVQPGSVANITTAECIAAGDIDIATAKKALDDANANKNKATNDKDRAIAQISVDLYSSLVYWSDK